MAAGDIKQLTKLVVNLRLNLLDRGSNPLISTNPAPSCYPNMVDAAGQKIALCKIRVAQVPLLGSPLTVKHCSPTSGADAAARDAARGLYTNSAENAMLYLFGWLLCGVIAAAIYSNKGRSGAAAFLVGALLGPIGVLLALLTPADAAGVERKQLDAGQMKRCPYCAELIRAEASICRYCNKEQPGATGQREWQSLGSGPAMAPLAEGARIVRGQVAGQFTCSACKGFVRADATQCKHCKVPFVRG